MAFNLAKKYPELLEEIKNKILVKYNLAEGSPVESVDTMTGEIIEEEEKTTKKSKKNIQ